MNALLVWLFGQSIIGNVIAACLWARLAARRYWDRSRVRLAGDTYFAIATGVTLVLTGAATSAVTRIAGAALTGDASGGRLPLGIVASLLSLSIGAGVLVWGGAIGRPRRGWRLFVSASLIWPCVLAAWLATRL